MTIFLSSHKTTAVVTAVDGSIELSGFSITQPRLHLLPVVKQHRRASLCLYCFVLANIFKFSLSNLPTDEDEESLEKLQPQKRLIDNS
ncbi:MAG: hypothetical protein A2744_03555 [Candidatus Buchananbacteria bacterium RIFCSPHIGHO2_01_FULL_44_11]|uniref:Uncharacterized protein n=1 Tax=Candidatus Buchananbacteria bacterium RIFCSPHIGHO2_01_FULL_44_11 TaxID=1797535 RepID=A0A1G1Y3U7_9BACT|nr:MAG: hypothetical protein A2744_03555 [Candidatus Buchananbacteria bacterium RIFCSPHIGHO2_01_FULL_44_11]